MQDVIAFWSYMAAACAFASVVMWRARRRPDRSETLLIGACFGTAVWAVIAAVFGRSDPMTMTFGTVRNLIWVMLLYDIAGGARGLECETAMGNCPKAKGLRAGGADCDTHRSRSTADSRALCATRNCGVHLWLACDRSGTPE